MPSEESRKPREMVHRAQGQCAQWLHELRRARQGLQQAPSRERARREWHDAVMLYYEQIKRFSHKEHIQDEWHEEEAVNGQTLADLGEKRLGTESETVQTRDPDTNATVSETRRRPWVLEPAEALDVYDQLDKCAHALGFDAEPDRIERVTGAGEAATTDPEDVDHLNANPLEASANGDD